MVTHNRDGSVRIATLDDYRFIRGLYGKRVKQIGRKEHIGVGTVVHIRRLRFVLTGWDNVTSSWCYMPARPIDTTREYAFAVWEWQLDCGGKLVGMYGMPKQLVRASGKLYELVANVPGYVDVWNARPVDESSIAA